jgi:hypothetical protein
MLKRALIPTAAIAVGALAVSLPTAEATRTVRIASHISIHSAVLTFSGHVTSPNAACDSNRRVTLYRTNGNVLGHARTGRTGHWRIIASGSAGISLAHFYARVSRRSEGAAGTIYVCQAARSATIPFHS